MGALARYGLAAAARRSYDVLSGGEKARLEVLVLELEGHNLLLLDEPTDNLDIDSSEALETALESFEGGVLAVSHDRAFLRRMDRFLMVTARRRRARPAELRGGPGGDHDARPGSRRAPREGPVSPWGRGGSAEELSIRVTPFVVWATIHERRTR